MDATYPPFTMEYLASRPKRPDYLQVSDTAGTICLHHGGVAIEYAPRRRRLDAWTVAPDGAGHYLGSAPLHGPEGPRHVAPADCPHPQRYCQEPREGDHGGLLDVCMSCGQVRHEGAHHRGVAPPRGYAEAALILRETRDLINQDVRAAVEA